MLTKQDIISAIQKTAKENGGKPLGIARFEQETGIRPYDWGKYWARFGDAQQEAGCTPNQLQGAYDEDFVFEKIIGLMRKLKKFPTVSEIVLERNIDNEFPSSRKFARLGTKEKLATKIFSYCGQKGGYDDIVRLCHAVLETAESATKEADEKGLEVGEVYLFKSGRYYKIGKTNNTVRRGAELRIQLPERTDLIHSIKTDDPIGVEAYWHKRFDAKRMKGEWFDLNSAEIKAFKRWRKIV